MALMRQMLLWASRQQWIGDQFRRRKFAQVAVRRFMPGEDAESALTAAQQIDRLRMSTVLTQLGENITELAEAKAVHDHYQGVLERIGKLGINCEISIKPTQLGLDVSPADCKNLVLDLTRQAGEKKNFVWIDMEYSSYVDATLDLYRTVRAKYPNVGLCLQAYLRRTPADVEALIPIKPSIRLVKGAYKESPTVAFPAKSDVDEAYYKISQTLLDKVAGRDGCRIGLGTHDTGLVRRIQQYAQTKNVAKDAYEIQMLYGIGRENQERFSLEGYKVRVLISYGAHWFPWYMRRLAERPANVWFVVKSMVS
jgi:proline dehydrogenase